MFVGQFLFTRVQHWFLILNSVFKSFSYPIVLDLYLCSIDFACSPIIFNSISHDATLLTLEKLPNFMYRYILSS